MTAVKLCKLSKLKCYHQLIYDSLTGDIPVVLYNGSAAKRHFNRHWTFQPSWRRIYCGAAGLCCCISFSSDILSVSKGFSGWAVAVRELSLGNFKAVVWIITAAVTQHVTKWNGQCSISKWVSPLLLKWVPYLLFLSYIGIQGQILSLLSHPQGRFTFLKNITWHWVSQYYRQNVHTVLVKNSLQQTNWQETVTKEEEMDLSCEKKSLSCWKFTVL